MPIILRVLIPWMVWFGATPAGGMSSVSATDADRAVAQAELALRAGEPQIAESRYRTALLEGWLLLGALEVASGDLDAAADAYRHAGRVAVETLRPTLALALVELRNGSPSSAADRLSAVRAQRPQDLRVRRLFARALAAAGRMDEAIEELSEAHAAFPDDLELTFSLATGVLRQGAVDKAAALFAQVVAARPSAATHVLVGRTWRDFGHFERARRSLERAIELDSNVVRARYYLGTTILRHDGRAALGEAIEHFRGELKVAPDDAIASLYLGIALVETRQFAEALEPLRAAGRGPAPRADAFLFEGQALLGLDRPSEALGALQRALERSRDSLTVAPDQLTSLHYQLARALRLLGRETEASAHFAAARDASVDLASSSRERLGRYLTDVDQPVAAQLDADGLESAALEGLGSAQRLALRRQLVELLARAYLNLGVLQSQAGRPGRAADLLSVGAAVAPDFPRLQYSLGVALFRAERYPEAIEPLQLGGDAASTAAERATARRMLALARLEVGDAALAAEILADEAIRGSDPSLHYAYALALVRSGRGDMAEPVFERLLAGHDDWAELHVLLGQVFAQRSEYPKAEASFGRALEIDPAVRGAHGALGEMYLREGDLAAAETALRAELASHPGDHRSQYNLATVLDLARRRDDAMGVLRDLLAVAPDHGDGRYLLGKILLARGEVNAAVVQLEAAAQLSPTAPEVRNQLGQAYQRLGEVARARAEFAAFRELKAKQREGG